MRVRGNASIFGTFARFFLAFAVALFYRASRRSSRQWRQLPGSPDANSRQLA